MTFKSIETRHELSGKPYLVLYGRAKEIAHKLRASDKLVSIIHGEECAEASVIFEKVD